MDRLVSLLERIVSDIAFSGTGEIRTDIIKQLETAEQICRELEMTTGETLCRQLKESAGEDGGRKTALLLCRLCCYMECIGQ